MLEGLRDRFTVLDSVGEGGFAHVYRARELASGRTVALKVLKESFLSNPTIVERFKREVFAVASIRSPHVVALHDFGISGKEVYFTMEYAEGACLRDLIGERAFTTDEIHTIIGQIAQALAAAHRCGIVHRDLKPENVMLVGGSDGRRVVKVLDFGLAKLADLERQLDLEPLTKVGMCFGTPQYMAPELIQGQPFDHGVDLYALGILTYEMVTGRLPWDDNDSLQVMLKVSQAPLPHLRRTMAQVARVPEIDRFLQRALAKSPGDRPRDAATFFRELELALYGVARPPRTAEALPVEDQPFASVWAASVAFDEPDDTADDTEVDPLHPRHRKLRSSWMKSVAELAVQPPDDDTTTPFQRAETPELMAFDAKTTRERTHTDVVRRGSLKPWMVLFVAGLVLCALALGYWLGRR